MLIVTVSKVWLLVTEVLILEVLAVPDQDLEAVELEEQVRKINQPNNDSDIAHAGFPLLYIVVVLIVVKGGVAVAQELSGRVIVLYRNDCDESRNHEEHEPEHVKVQEPRVPLVHLILLIRALLGAHQIPPGLHVSHEEWQLEN